MPRKKRIELCDAVIDVGFGKTWCNRTAVRWRKGLYGRIYRCRVHSRAHNQWKEVK